MTFLDLKPAAIEHIDRPLFDGTKGQFQFQAARDLLELESKPCESIPIVEFYEDVAERLSILQSKKIGLRTKILTDPAQMNMVWSVRKSGLSLLTGSSDRRNRSRSSKTPLFVPRNCPITCAVCNQS